MFKKKKTLESAPQGKRAKKAKGRTNGSVTKRALAKHPVSQRLPSMEVDAVLHGHASRVSKIRAEMNELRLDETAELQGAHRRMRQLKKSTFMDCGVEFVRVPGEEKLRCRTTKEKTSAATDEEPDDTQVGDAPEGNEDLASMGESDGGEIH